MHICGQLTAVGYVMPGMHSALLQVAALRLSHLSLSAVFGLQIRSALFHGSQIITGGEDARVCVWGDLEDIEAEMLAESSGGAVKATTLKTARHSPY
jgi:hypothetical protein